MVSVLKEKERMPRSQVTGTSFDWKAILGGPTKWYEVTGKTLTVGKEKTCKCPQAERTGMDGCIAKLHGEKKQLEAVYPNPPTPKRSPEH